MKKCEEIGKRHSCRDFINFVTYGYIGLATMKTLNIKDKDGKAADFPDENDEVAKEIYLNELAQKIAKEYIYPDSEIKKNMMANQK